MSRMSRIKCWALAALGIVAMAGLGASTAYAAPENEKGPRCSDTIDNDGDGLTDGDDPDCGATGDSGGKIQFWTGEDLYDDKKVSFPTDFPTLDGTAINFASGSIPNGKLIEYALKGIPKKGDVVVRVTMNLTRLSNDWDPYIVLTDGTNWSGVAVYENSGGGVSTVEGTDSGDRGVLSGSNVLFSPVAIPAIGGSVDVAVEFTLSTAATSISASLLGSSGSYVSGPLDRTSLSFVFMRDNEASESYGVNSLSIQRVQ